LGNALKIHVPISGEAKREYPWFSDRKSSLLIIAYNAMVCAEYIEYMNRMSIDFKYDPVKLIEK